MMKAEGPEEHPDEAFREAWVSSLYEAQSSICSAVEELEASFAAEQQQQQQQQDEDAGPRVCAKKFENTRWERGPGQGGGLTRVFQEALAMCPGARERLEEALRAPRRSSGPPGAPPGAPAPPPASAGAPSGPPRPPGLSPEAPPACRAPPAGPPGGPAGAPGRAAAAGAPPGAPQGGERGGAPSLSFFAAGLSLVLHPEHPMAPSGHMNYRLFQIFGEEESLYWWFGGGADLSPAYVFAEDCEDFHRGLQQQCMRCSSSFYPQFKRWADGYFWLPHRREARGVGGIFFDGLNWGLRGLGPLRAFCVEGLFGFAPLYLPIVRRRSRPAAAAAAAAAHRRWQLLRRGRYVEFNLLCDRGTRFGFSLPGSRTDSILASLPLLARWENPGGPPGGPPGEGAPGEWPPPGSHEAQSLEVFRHPKDWVLIDSSLAADFQLSPETLRPACLQQPPDVAAKSKLDAGKEQLADS